MHDHNLEPTSIFAPLADQVRAVIGGAAMRPRRTQADRLNHLLRSSYDFVMILLWLSYNATTDGGPA